MKLVFNKIHREAIFNPEFDCLSEENGTIEFRRKSASGGIAVIYAPNGAGKTSIAEVLKSDTSSGKIDFSAEDEKGNKIDPSDCAFHIISDQISRNIIKGNESEYLVGADIRREYELAERVKNSFTNTFASYQKEIKDKYKVSKVGDYLVLKLKDFDTQAHSFIKNIVNVKYKGQTIEKSELIKYIKAYPNEQLPILDDEKISFVVNDCSDARIVSKLLNMASNEIKTSGEAPLIERNNDAINILTKYRDLDHCVVCDNDNFDSEELIKNKIQHNTAIYSRLDDATKKLMNEVANHESLNKSDPFGIKKIVMDFIAGQGSEKLDELKDELELYVKNVCLSMIQELVSRLKATNVIDDFEELEKLQQTKPELDSDDLIYIQDVISENIDRDIRIDRDAEHGNIFKLMLGDSPLLNVKREDMLLSTGEQNFISLAFELLLAKNSKKEYVVLDDPISSFDSVYKNKIAYCIVKFVDNKKLIVMTHNLDLIRLLEYQNNGCFNLYMLNNHDGARNGFIPVKGEEIGLLIDLSKLIHFLQNKDGKLLNAIKDKRVFLMSMIPFMRGYAHISFDGSDCYGKLSKIMHGYGTSSEDLVMIYNQLFGQVFEGNEIVSAKDILSLNGKELSFFDKDKYPLLTDALSQSLIYCYLRMTVEKKLIDVFGISISADDRVTLNQIIQEAFKTLPNDKLFKEKRADRVFFVSRKTLLNEFNHFEGNINIFQPAIDITASRLEKERKDIIDRLEAVEKRYGGNAV